MRRIALPMTLAPAFAALLAAGFLQERLPGAGWLGMGVTIAGVALAVRGRAPGGPAAGIAEIPVRTLMAAGSRPSGIARVFSLPSWGTASIHGLYAA